MASRVSLSELSGAGVRLRAAEAAAIVSEICRLYGTGVLRGMPSSHIVRLTEQGTVVVEGPVNTDRAPVSGAAALLDELLAGVDGPSEYRAPGALRLAVARALVKIDEAHRRKLRDLGLLTRDARAVERKKPGRPKARKRFQFSKR